MPRTSRRLLTLLATIGALIAALPAFAAGATISGHVEDAGGAAVTTEAICVTARATDGTAAGSTTSSASTGAYRLTVAAGTWTIVFTDCVDSGSARDDAPTYYGTAGTGRFADATPLTFAASDARTGFDVRMRPGADLAGHVYDGPGTAIPISSTCMTIVPTSGPALGRTASSSWTDDGGSFRYTRLDPDFTYKVLANPCPGRGYVPAWYDGAATQQDATPVTAPASGIDFHLDATTSVSGTVREADGTPVTTGGVCVMAISTDPNSGDRQIATVGNDGTYRVTGISGGEYRVRFQDCDGSSRLDAALYYGGSWDPDRATPIAVPGGSHVTGIDGTMQPGTTIAGHVYGGAGTGAPLWNACVIARAGNQRLEAQALVGGVYSLDHLPALPGGYEITAGACSVSHVSDIEYIDDTEHVTPAAGSSVARDFHLQAGGSVSGTVTRAADGGPVDGSSGCRLVDARRTDADGQTYERVAPLWQSDGTYTIGGLPSGTYTVSYRECDGRTAGAGRSYRPAAVSGIAVTAPADTAGVNLVLESGTTIAGRVVLGSGAFAPDACVQAYDATGDGATALSTAKVVPGGGYALSGLDPSKTYKVAFGPCAGVAAPLTTTFWSGATTFATATTVTPTVNAPASGIDGRVDVASPPPAAGDGDPAPDPGTESGTQTGGSGTLRIPASAPVTGGGTSTPSPIVGAGRVATSKPFAFGAFAAQRLTRVLRLGLTVPVRCATTCAVTVRVTVDRVTARRLGLGRSAAAAVLGTVRVTGRGATARRVVVRLTARARRALAKRRSLAVNVVLTDTAHAGTPARVTRRLVLAH